MSVDANRKTHTERAGGAGEGEIDAFLPKDFFACLCMFVSPRQSDTTRDTTRDARATLRRRKNCPCASMTGVGQGSKEGRRNKRVVGIPRESARLLTGSGDAIAEGR